MSVFRKLSSVLILVFVSIQVGQAQFQRLAVYRQPPELTKRDKDLTAINPSDKTAFADFLNADETGYVRLHDAVNCNLKSSVLDVSDPCPWNIPGKATTYSFRKEKYRSAIFSDLALLNSNFQVVGINLLGFLVELGDVSLNKISLQNEGVKTMADFIASDDIKEIEKQYAAAEKGFRVGKFLYISTLPVKEKTTYVLRAIAYQGKVYRKANSFKINILEGDTRIDLTLALRVIRKHEDGSVSILWKELSRKDSPKIKFDKSGKKQFKKIGGTKDFG